MLGVNKVILVLFLINHCLFSQESFWVKNVTGEAILENTTAQKGIETARLNAFGEALRQQGVKINAVQFLMQYENLKDNIKHANTSFVSLVKTASEGIVAEYANEIWEVRNLRSEKSEPPLVQFVVTLDARITKPKGKPDPNFKIQLTLDKPSYWDGDKLEINIVSTQDCYITVINITVDSASILVPSNHIKNNFIRAYETVKFPPEGISITAEIPAGWEFSEDMIVVIAMKQQKDFVKFQWVDKESKFVKSRQATLTELMDWIASIPLDQIAECIERFEIRKRSF